MKPSVLPAVLLNNLNYDVQEQGDQNEVSKSVVDKIAAQANTTRKWVFKTDEYGEIKLNNSYKVSGDNLYYNGDLPTMPVGTVVIHEIAAPTGYLNDNESVYWVRSITGNNSGTNTVETYNAPT